jgi:hypothetical protein
MALGSYSTKTPAIIPGLITWLDATDPSGNGTQPSDGTAIVTWVDKSGRGYSPTQGTGANQPLFKTNILNGKPVIRFDGSNDQLTKTSYYDVGLFSLFIVCTYGGTNQSSYSISNGSLGTGMATSYVSPNLISRYVQGTSTAKDVNESISTPTGFHLWDCYADGTNYYLYDNGVSQGSIAATINTNTINRLDIAGNVAGSFILNGDIAEFIVYNYALASGDQILIRKYLANKWGISVS